MILPTSEEQLFLDEIDCRFPYGDSARCQELIERGIRLSPNAAVSVLHEICRPPKSADVSRARLENLVDQWRAQCDHPLADPLSQVAKAMINGRQLEIEDVIKKIELVGLYQGLYAALTMLHFACDDRENRLEAIDSSVQSQWARDDLE